MTQGRSKRQTNAADVRLYLVADPVFMRSRSVEDAVAQAAWAGVDMIQLREKFCSNEEFLCLAHRFSQVLRAYRIPLIINDRVDVAKQVGAQGVHLGQSDLIWQEARRILGENSIIGVSVENLKQAEQVVHADIDYLGVSGVFATTTKPELQTPWGLAGIRELRGQTSHALIGIGGIDENNAASVVAAGVDGIAVVTAITLASQPGLAAQRLREVINNSYKGKTK